MSDDRSDDEILDRIERFQYDKLKKRYEQTGNPLYVWEAVFVTNPRPPSSSMSLPIWVMDYLQKCAWELMIPSIGLSNPKDFLETQRTLAQIFNLGSPSSRSSTTRKHLFKRNINMVQWLGFYRELGCRRDTAFCFVAEQWEVSEETVAAAWKSTGRRWRDAKG